MQKKNRHTLEAHFVEIVPNWHKAADRRELTEDIQSKYNNDMNNFLLGDWTAWHKSQRDFSILYVMRPPKGIQGFTREIVVALIANCESLEIRRAEYQREDCPQSIHMQAAQMMFRALLHISMINLERSLTTRNFWTSNPKFSTSSIKDRPRSSVLLLDRTPTSAINCSTAGVT